MPVVAKVLLHSGVDDDAATDVATLEQEFEVAGATFEIIRYGSDIFHLWSGVFALRDGPCMTTAQTTDLGKTQSYS